MVQHISYYVEKEQLAENVFLNSVLQAERKRGDAYAAPAGDDQEIELEYWKAVAAAESVRCSTFRELYSEIVGEVA